MRWVIYDTFNPWFQGHRFTVWTDNNLLKYVLTKPKLAAMFAAMFPALLVALLVSSAG